MGNFSGIKKVEYATAGTSFASPVNLGSPLSESGGYAPETQTQETGKGTMIYAGVKKETIYLFTDLTKFTALETIMKADTEIDVRITDNEDSVETIALAASVQVKKVISTAVGTRNHFEMKFQSFEI